MPLPFMKFQFHGFIQIGIDCLTTEHRIRKAMALFHAARAV